MDDSPYRMFVTLTTGIQAKVMLYNKNLSSFQQY